MIELKDLTKRYGKFLAVDRLNLYVAKNEIFGFIGPNGAGKTTTIRMMGGVLAPTSGTVVIDGIDINNEPEEVKKKIGFIPDRPFLYEKLTGMEFMRFSADIYGIDGDEFYDKSWGLLKKFGLSDWSHELIESYSHGMKQRLIISAALLHEPSVIIVDEPMVGLDPAAIKIVKDLFRTLAENGTTIFMSTHTLEIAESICDRISVIYKGSIIATGTMEELKQLAGRQDAQLEEVFLKLTEEQAVT